MPQNTQEASQEAQDALPQPQQEQANNQEPTAAAADDAAVQATIESLKAEGKKAPVRKPVDPNAPVMVEFKHVFKKYNLYKNDVSRMLGLISKRVPRREVCASNDLSFTIRKGESVAFLGHNGAGKSTALKMITGVVFPTEGEVIVNGRVSALLELRAGFDRDLTGRENIRLRGQIWGLSEKQIDKLEPKVIKFAELGQYIDQPLRTYSSGMKARLGFAFASSVKPEILIVDEALGVGDRRFKRKCRRRVNRIMNRRNITMIFVTHSSASARKFCERGIVLEHGQILFDGPIDDAIEFYEHKDEIEEAQQVMRDRAAGIDENDFIDSDEHAGTDEKAAEQPAAEPQTFGEEQTKETEAAK